MHSNIEEKCPQKESLSHAKNQWDTFSEKPSKVILKPKTEGSVMSPLEKTVLEVLIQYKKDFKIQTTEKEGDFRVSPLVKTSPSIAGGAGSILVGELRSHVPHWQEKKQKPKT